MGGIAGSRLHGRRLRAGGVLPRAPDELRREPPSGGRSGGRGQARPDRPRRVRPHGATQPGGASRASATRVGGTARARARGRPAGRRRIPEQRRRDGRGARRNEPRRDVLECRPRHGNARAAEPLRAAGALPAVRRLLVGAGRRSGARAADADERRGTRRRGRAFRGRGPGPLAGRAGGAVRGRVRRGRFGALPLQPPAVRPVHVGYDRPAEVHRPRGRRHASRARQGAPPARRPATRRRDVLPHLRRLDDVELAAVGACLAERDRDLRRADRGAGHALADRLRGAGHRVRHEPSVPPAVREPRLLAAAYVPPGEPEGGALDGLDPP